MRRIIENEKTYFYQTNAKFEPAVFDKSMQEADFISPGGTKYWYTEKYLYRYADHWGKVGSCSWSLLNTDSKFGDWHLGRVKWTDIQRQWNEKTREAYEGQFKQRINYICPLTNQQFHITNHVHTFEEFCKLKGEDNKEVETLMCNVLVQLGKYLLIQVADVYQIREYNEESGSILIGDAYRDLRSAAEILKNFNFSVPKQGTRYWKTIDNEPLHLYNHIDDIPEWRIKKGGYRIKEDCINDFNDWYKQLDNYLEYAS